MLHVVKLLVERQRHIIYVKVGMFNYCFITVSDYMLVFVMVFVNIPVWESSVTNMVAEVM